jgi:hypothetical protein
MRRPASCDAAFEFGAEFESGAEFKMGSCVMCVRVAGCVGRDNAENEVSIAMIFFCFVLVCCYSDEIVQLSKCNFGLIKTTDFLNRRFAFNL